MHITLIKKYAHECFLFVYFYLIKFSCQNTIFIFFLKIQWELWDKNGKKCKKVKKREKNTKVPERYMTIFPLFFSYFSLFSSSSSFLHCRAEARARFGRSVGLKTTRKWDWKGKQGQNGVVLVPKNKKIKKNRASLPSATWRRRRRGIVLVPKNKASLPSTTHHWRRKPKEEEAEGEEGDRGSRRFCRPRRVLPEASALHA